MCNVLAAVLGSVPNAVLQSRFQPTTQALCNLIEATTDNVCTQVQLLLLMPEMVLQMSLPI